MAAELAGVAFRRRFPSLRALSAISRLRIETAVSMIYNVSMCPHHAPLFWMQSIAKQSMRLWTWLVPWLALGLLFLALAVGVGTLLAAVCGAALVGAVLAAVHHAEVVAHRVGEPLGTIVLAL